MNYRLGFTSECPAHRNWKWAFLLASVGLAGISCSSGENEGLDQQGQASITSGCTTTITYGSAWIHAPNHPASYDVVAGPVTWDGKCTDSGSGSYATLSNGWAPHFQGHGACAIAIESQGSCSNATSTGPCDIYAQAGTPCVAAHSTVRAMYGNYQGPLYQVTRASDRATKDIRVLSAGGIADASVQDSFCTGTTCTISVIYDHSPNHNDLRVAPGGSANPQADMAANASALPVTIGGRRAYGVYIAPGIGYRNNTTRGVATGDQPEGEYMVASGSHYNEHCCFDYGNAETNNVDTGAGHMEAVYFGGGPGPNFHGGPWVLNDLENGLFGPQNAVPYPYVTAIVKGEPNHWAIEDGNAQTGGLAVKFDGARPQGYNPMHKEGAVILGIGGDNSNGAIGGFFEGCMTTGFPSNATDSAVQANLERIS